jgi:hypothetical protein
MEQLNHASQSSAFRSEFAERLEQAAVQVTAKRESMPFTIRIVTADHDLRKAVDMRRMAYGRHLPAFAEKLGIEKCDRDPGVAILLAESKLDGAPLGTMRIQTNEYAPLAVEQSVRLPNWLAGSRLAEATRLGVAGGGIGRVVKVMLCKALWLYCEQQLVDYMVITARSPLDREYEGMLFEDVFGEREFLPMAHVGGLPHRVLAKDVMAARRRWEEARHPLFQFMVHTDHPDLDLRTPDLSFQQEPVRCPEAPQVVYGR